MDQRHMDVQEEKKPVPEFTLRPFDLADIDDFMLWASDDRIMRFSRWPTCTTKAQGLAHMKEFIMPHPWCRAICVGGRPVGLVAVTPALGADVHRASIGYHLAYGYWGRGIVTAAVKQAVSTIFKEWPHLERLQAITDVGNRGSQRVLEKAGFQREAVFRSYLVLRGENKDLVMYNLLSTDPIVNLC